MAKSKLISRIGALALAAALACTSLISASAATIDKATIDMDAKAQLSIYKYDFTNAKKDGVWNEDSYVSTGQYDAKVNEVLGGTTRTGANSASSALGNGQASNGYAINGVEYTYLKIADITQFTESEKDGGRTDSHIEVLYAIDKVKGADMLAAIGLADGKNSYENANALDANNWYYQSDVLSAALKAALEANSTTVKNSLEAYVKNNGGTAMPKTNEDGYSNVTGLPVGLYLLVETRTPEMVTGTTNPCFVSLPMTTVDGGMADGSGNQITTGGQDWNYNVVLYPKNETGIVTLEKTVREAAKDTGINNASDVITDGFTHNATASAGDTIEYQIISTLPTITSAATNISAYTFQDVLARGLSYVGGTNSVTLEFFTDANCTNKVTTWKQSDGKFKVTREENNDGTHTMTISMPRSTQPIRLTITITASSMPVTAITHFVSVTTQNSILMSLWFTVTTETKTKSSSHGSVPMTPTTTPLSTTRIFTRMRRTSRKPLATVKKNRRCSITSSLKRRMRPMATM